MPSNSGIGARRGRDDNRQIVGGVLRTIDRHDLDIQSPAHLGGEFAAFGFVAAVDERLLDRPGHGDCFQLRAGLMPGAEQAEFARPRRRPSIRPPRPVVAAVRNWPSRSASIIATRAPVCAVVQTQMKLRTPPRVVRVALPADQTEIIGRGAHRVQHDAASLGPHARHVVGFAIGQLAKRFFHHLDRQRHIEQLIDVGFGQIQGGHERRLLVGEISPTFFSDRFAVHRLGGRGSCRAGTSTARQEPRPPNVKSLSENRRGLAHFAVPWEQNVAVPLSSAGSRIGSKRRYFSNAAICLKSAFSERYKS